MDPLVQWLTTALTVPAVAHMAITSHPFEAYFVAFPITFMPRSSDIKLAALTTVALVTAAVDTPPATEAAVTQLAMAAAAIRHPTEAVATAHRTAALAASHMEAQVTVALVPTAPDTAAPELSTTELPTVPLPTQFSMLRQAAL